MTTKKKNPQMACETDHYRKEIPDLLFLNHYHYFEIEKQLLSPEYERKMIILSFLMKRNKKKNDEFRKGNLNCAVPDWFMKQFFSTMRKHASKELHILSMILLVKPKTGTCCLVFIFIVTMFMCLFQDFLQTLQPGVPLALLLSSCVK